MTTTDTNTNTTGRGGKPRLQRQWTDVNSSHREWNRIAEAMDAYHNYFRWEFKNIYDNAAGGFHKDGKDLKAFLRDAQGLTRHIGAHHRTEEVAIFPRLAHKLPMFRKDAGEHTKQHHEIHAGLSRYDAYITQALADPSTYNFVTLRVIMDSFRRVLFDHLDQEVRDLGAASLQKHGFTIDEVRAFPM